MGSPQRRIHLGMWTQQSQTKMSKSYCLLYGRLKAYYLQSDNIRSLDISCGEVPVHGEIIPGCILGKLGLFETSHLDLLRGTVRLTESPGHNFTWAWKFCWTPRFVEVNGCTLFVSNVHNSAVMADISIVEWKDALMPLCCVASYSINTYHCQH